MFWSCFTSTWSLCTPYFYISFQFSGFFFNCKTNNYECLAQKTGNPTNSAYRVFLHNKMAAIAVRVLCSLCLCALMLLASGFCLYVHKMVAILPILICSRLEQHRKVFSQVFAFLFMKKGFL